MGSQFASSSMQEEDASSQDMATSAHPRRLPNGWGHWKGRGKRSEKRRRKKKKKKKERKETIGRRWPGTHQRERGRRSLAMRWPAAMSSSYNARQRHRSTKENDDE